MAGKRRRHNPLVVRLVKTLVDERVVQVSVDPVDAKVGKDEEERELEDVVPETGALISGVVQLAVTTNFHEEDWSGTNGHEGHGFVRLDDFKPNLAFEKSWVIHGTLVKDEIVGESGKDEVDEQPKEPRINSRQ